MVKMVKTNLVFSTVTLITFLGLAKGTITCPPDGQRFVFLPGSSHNITWTLNVTEDINLWLWGFTPRGSSSPQQIAVIFPISDIPQYSPSPLTFEVFKPGTLWLKNVNQSYNGEFSFTIFTIPRTPPSKVNVYIAVKPNVIINCSTPLVVNEGDNVSCVCRGEGGNPPANVTWFDKNNNIIGDVGVVSKTLVITNVTLNDGGSYRCKAQSYNDPRFRDEKSIEVTVKATYPPQQTNITISPMSVRKGQNVTITCESDGYPEPTYTIYHNGAVISNNKTYIIQSVNFNNAGSYRCEAKNKLGNDSSDVKNLTIIKVKATYPPQQTNITISPMSVRKGQNVTITCESDGYPEPTYTIYHNGAVISNNKTYIIQSVNFNNAVKPKVVINCSKPLVVNEGDNVSCVCRGEGGIPPANVTWFDKNNNIIGDVGVVSKTLVITNVTLNDGGNYTCKAQSYNDPRFRDEKSIEVTVKATYPPQQTNITISPMSVRKGQNVTITCESDGYPEPTYTIYHNGAVISNNKTYIIQSVNFNNAGSYRCEAKNKLGNDSSDVKNLTIIKYKIVLNNEDSYIFFFVGEIQIRLKPKVVINCSKPLVVNEGDNVSCVCRGEGGIPPANVTWFDKDNNIIGDVGVVSKTLVITNVTLNDGGNYTCKAQSYNDQRYRDEKSIEITVTPTYPPQQTNITISPMSLKKGQTVTITCESDGYPEPTYTIYHNGAVISNNKTYIIQSVNFNNAGSYRCEAKNKLGSDLSDKKDTNSKLMGKQYKYND
ncbi:neural cell adhesion molecule 1-like [Xenia sp. Carnegie-2017]|uniref:neural cell adhesion molecule 1-like n=1 Tax=Xenia sp. Carnegie-2017 TaxID=2897299 RepID=UPI001F03BBCE|nr:neural cell adhesion molecule 1-like [Xenia sp. Carnegie-2017]